jgi:hypothetical protein
MGFFIFGSFFLFLNLLAVRVPRASSCIKFVTRLRQQHLHSRIPMITRSHLALLLVLALATFAPRVSSAQFIYAFDSLDFGKVKLGSSALLMDTITNGYSMPVYIGNLQSLGPSTDIFLEKPLTMPPFLPQGRKYWFNVEFKPTKLGMHVDTFTVSQYASGRGEMLLVRGEAVDTPHVGVEAKIESSAMLAISVFPNPAIGSAEVNLTLPKSGAMSLSLIDVMGRVVKLFDNAWSDRGTHQIKIDLSRIPVGAYHLMVRSQNLKTITSIVVAR